MWLLPNSSTCKGSEEPDSSPQAQVVTLRPARSRDTSRNTAEGVETWHVFPPPSAADSHAARRTCEPAPPGNARFLQSLDVDLNHDHRFTRAPHSRLCNPGNIPTKQSGAKVTRLRAGLAYTNKKREGRRYPSRLLSVNTGSLTSTSPNRRTTDMIRTGGEVPRRRFEHCLLSADG